MIFKTIAALAVELTFPAWILMSDSTEVLSLPYQVAVICVFCRDISRPRQSPQLSAGADARARPSPKLSDSPQASSSVHATRQTFKKAFLATRASCKQSLG